MKEMPRLIIVLTVIAILSGLVLAFTYNTTHDKIVANAEAKKQRAMSEVLPGMDRFEETSKGDFHYYQGYDAAGNPGGIAVEASGGGFQGEIKLMVGILVDENKISALKILSHTETPGLGAKITETGYLSNFENKPFGEYSVVKRPVKKELEVEAIAGATISSQKVTDIIEKTLEDVKEAFGGEF